MTNSWTLLLTVAWIAKLALLDHVSDYMQQRALYLRNDDSTRTGHDMVLSEKELTVSKILEALIRAELDSEVSKDKSIMETNFIMAKSVIDKSAVFDLIRKMPKGV